MLVVWLKSHQRLGYFPKIGEMPTAVAGHVREALGLAEEVKLRQAAAMTASRRSEFDRLKDVAKAASLGKFKERLALLGDIDALGPTGTWLQSVPPGKAAHFAGEARVTDAADMRKVGEDKRLTLLASFVHTVAIGIRDDVATMFCKRMAAIHKKGRDQLEALREAHRAESERLLGVFGDVLSAVRDALVLEESSTPEGDQISPQQPKGPAHGAGPEVAERAGHLVLKTLERAGGVEALTGAHEAISAHHSNNYLPLLEQYYQRAAGRAAWPRPSRERRPVAARPAADLRPFPLPRALLRR